MEIVNKIIHSKINTTSLHRNKNKGKKIEVKKEADEATSISILRTNEEDDSLENIFRYAEDEIIGDYDSEYSFSTHEDSEDLKYLCTPQENLERPTYLLAKEIGLKKLETPEDLLERLMNMEDETFNE